MQICHDHHEIFSEVADLLLEKTQRILGGQRISPVMANADSDDLSLATIMILPLRHRHQASKKISPYHQHRLSSGMRCALSLKRITVRSFPSIPMFCHRPIDSRLFIGLHHPSATLRDATVCLLTGSVVRGEFNYFGVRERPNVVLAEVGGPQLLVDLKALALLIMSHTTAWL
jgi:hypothetical protein